MKPFSVQNRESFLLVQSLLLLGSGKIKGFDKKTVDQLLYYLEFTNVRYWNRLFIPIYRSLRKIAMDTGSGWKPSVSLQKRFLNLMTVQVQQQIWLTKVVNQLISEQIPVILLKNASHIGTIYTVENARLSQDIDLLVQPKDYVAAITCLKSFTRDGFPDFDAGFLACSNHEFTLPIDTDIDFSIEVHRHLVPKVLFDIDYEKLWQSSIQHPMWESEIIRTLSPEYAILHSAIHGFLHVEFESHHLVDAMRICESNDVNWSNLCELSRKWQCEAVVLFLAQLLAEYFGQDLPNSFSHNAQKRCCRNASRLRDPSNPLLRDPTRREQLLSMMLHDSPFRIGLFFLYYNYRQGRMMVQSWLKSRSFKG